MLRFKSGMVLKGRGFNRAASTPYKDAALAAEGMPASKSGNCRVPEQPSSF
jgi:hypothetical protein